VKQLIKNPIEIREDLSNQKINAWHMATGVSGEAGEVLELIKKWVVYGKPMARADLIKELGDIEFYLTGLRYVLDIGRQEVLDANFEKLAARYPTGYTDKQAIERVDVDDE
jgi:NTP pyrophosphatase (non-canonical NTP hydrolase)